MSHPDTLPHSHEPNPFPPNPEADLRVTGPGLAPLIMTVAELTALPTMEQVDCYIVSTGHGTSGPFRFRGPALSTVAAHCGITDFADVRITGDDGFFTLLTARETADSRLGHTAMLALAKDGQALTREQGLVRLVVPTEKDNALKQIKWISCIDFRTSEARPKLPCGSAKAAMER